MKVLIVLSCIFASAFAGVVVTDPCGGVGTFREMRIQGCEGEVADMHPAQPYPCEGDFTPSTSCQMLHLKVVAHVFGQQVTIVDTALANSSVQQGVPYTVRFTITPNDVLKGRQFPVETQVSCSGTTRIEVCRRVSVNVL